MVAILFAFGTEIGDIVTSKLNDKYCYWAGTRETNDLIATPDGHMNVVYAIEVKAAWWTILVFTSIGVYLATRSSLLASLPFLYSAYSLLPVVLGNALLFARYHHILHH